MAMLDQAPPETLEARVAGYVAPSVPQAVLVALQRALAQAGRALVVGVRYADGRQGQMLALTGVASGAEAKVARAVTEALAFSGIEAGALDVVFLASDNPVIGRMAGIALVLETHAPATPEVPGSKGPGLDPARPPILRR
jgi:hypothetical protein